MDDHKWLSILKAIDSKRLSALSLEDISAIYRLGIHYFKLIEKVLRSLPHPNRFILETEITKGNYGEIRIAPYHNNYAVLVWPLGEGFLYQVPKERAESIGHLIVLATEYYLTEEIAEEVLRGPLPNESPTAYIDRIYSYDLIPK